MNYWVIYLSISYLVMLEVTIELILHLNLLTDFFSSLLFLTIDHFFSWINYFSTIMNTDKEVWSNGYLRFGNIVWLLNCSDSVLRNIRFSTEFESWELSEISHRYWSNRCWYFQTKVICYFLKCISIWQMAEIQQVLVIISTVKVPCHNQNII